MNRKESMESQIIHLKQARQIVIRGNERTIKDFDDLILDIEVAIRNIKPNKEESRT